MDKPKFDMGQVVYAGKWEPGKFRSFARIAGARSVSW